MSPDDRARSYAAMPWPEFRSRWETLPTKAQRNEALRLRFRYDRAGFLRYLFPDQFSRAFNPYHLAALGRVKVPWRQRLGSGRRTLRADAAPRGIAKTTLAKGEMVHDVLNGMERVVPILSAEASLSRSLCADVMEMLNSPAVRALYGPVKIEGGVQRFRATTTTGDVCAFIAKSFGTSVRGMNDGSARPTKILIDDGENRLLVDNPDNRRKWWSFLTEDVLKLGDFSGGLLVEFRGTVLHPDSVLSRLLKSTGWESSLYQACISWPTRTDLWDQCERIWGDLDRGDLETRRGAALDFYHAHQEDMDRGVKMLDPIAMPIFSFYEIKWADGLGALLREYQNTPRDPSACIFDSASFARCRVVTTPGGELAVVRLDREGNPEGAPVRRRDLRVTLRLDPIPADDLGGIAGGAGGSDYACICAIGRDQQDRGYVLDTWLKRGRDTDQIAALWTMAEKWRPEGAKIESNGFQRLLGQSFRRIRDERAAAGLYHQLPVASTADSVESGSKNTDIATLEAPISMRWLYFAEDTPQDGLNQFDTWPNGDHDDFPDTVARGYRDSQRRGAVGAVGSFER